MNLNLPWRRQMGIPESIGREVHRPEHAMDRAGFLGLRNVSRQGMANKNSTGLLAASHCAGMAFSPPQDPPWPA